MLKTATFVCLFLRVLHPQFCCGAFKNSRRLLSFFLFYLRVSFFIAFYGRGLVQRVEFSNEISVEKSVSFSILILL
jgi:hypothetical protein